MIAQKKIAIALVVIAGLLFGLSLIALSWLR